MTCKLNLFPIIYNLKLTFSIFLELSSYYVYRCLEHIEEMIHKQEPLVSVLRLLVLLSVTNAGLPKRNFDYLRLK